VLAGVCTGVMLLARAGVIGARPATTHHGAKAELEAAGVKVVDERVVDAGGLVTAGGVTSGIDLALRLVERVAGPAGGGAAAEGGGWYWGIDVGWRRAENIAWAYGDPRPERADLKGRIAFYQPRLDAFYVREGS